MALFRIVQEALNNTYKHAQATQSWVDLYYLRDGIEVEIVDDGRGLPVSVDEPQADEGVPSIYSGHGLANMQARAEELEGTFALMPVPTGGVKVKVYVPVV
jgi:signal transduction histidine kinase